MECVTVMLSLVLLLAPLKKITSIAIAPCDFPAVYNFGDSNSDTGGISAAFEPIQAPYGESFFRGRFSDGRLLIDFIDSIGSNFRHGAIFATGGSTIRRRNETIFQSGISPFSLDVQIVHFHRFQSRTEELYRQEKNKLPRPREFSKSLYTIDIGQTDLAVGFHQMSNIQLRTAIPDIINQFSAAVTTAESQDKNVESRAWHAAITYVDVYAAKYELISNAKSQGFMEPQKICCGLQEGNTHVWCGQKGIVRGAEVFGGACVNPSDYISWDGIHYSQAANQWIVDHILNGSFSDPPIPITHACHKHLHY
ncbi:hypothetical protein MTR67_010982 [Solanum verrucosum]|uniref:Esterase n=1 Tax=Solanum verrucosum TaxID=315347 RepID=A0AAF0Q761_SOLVR|nr:hypothetical protein MTR67_010982 [Solanum verrucosum]